VDPKHKPIILVGAEFLGIHVHCEFWVTLSPYFIQFIVIFCKTLSTVHIASYYFAYFFCSSLSLFYLCMFRCILGLVAVTVTEWSGLVYYYYYYYYYSETTNNSVVEILHTVNGKVC